jgi:hypothetical protein
VAGGELWAVTQEPSVAVGIVKAMQHSFGLPIDDDYDTRGHTRRGADTVLCDGRECTFKAIEVWLALHQYNGMFDSTSKGV